MSTTIYAHIHALIDPNDLRLYTNSGNPAMAGIEVVRGCDSVALTVSGADETQALADVLLDLSQELHLRAGAMDAARAEAAEVGVPV